METRIAYTFIKVAELGSITRAAEQLGYSQGAVTTQIRQLEADLGISLFDRIGRGIQLTEAGNRFKEYAARLIRASEDADAFALDKLCPEGSLIIETTSSVSIGILSALLPEFHREYPGIRTVVRVSEDTDVLIEHLRQNRIDFAIIFTPSDDFEGCTKIWEKEEQFAFVAHSSDPLAGRRNVPLADIFDGSFISTFISTDRNMEFKYTIEPYLRSRGYIIEPAIEFGTIASIVNLLKKGWGHAFLPLFMVEDEIRNGELSLIDTESVPVTEFVQLFSNENKWVSPQMQAFIDFICTNALG